MAKQPDRRPSSDGIDGHIRSRAAEAKLNKLCAAVLGDDAGQEWMAYLKSITINYVNGPHVGPNELLHAEGARYVVAILQARIDAGHKENARG